MIKGEGFAAFDVAKSELAFQKISSVAEHSPLALCNRLTTAVQAQGVAPNSREMKMLFEAGDLVEKSFPHDMPTRQEEVKVYPAVHSYRVALGLVESRAIPPESVVKYATIALLHDVLEDTDVSREGLERQFGKEIADGVVLLSKSVDGKKISDKEYFDQLQAAPKEIQWIKVADRIENLAVLLRMSEAPGLEGFHLPSGRSIQEALRHNYEEAMLHILPFAEGNEILKQKLTHTLSAVAEKLQKFSSPTE